MLDSPLLVCLSWSVIPYSAARKRVRDMEIEREQRLMSKVASHDARIRDLCEQKNKVSVGAVLPRVLSTRVVDPNCEGATKWLA